MLVLIFLTALLAGSHSLKCYKCLNFECPEGDDGEKNEKLCQSARSYIIKSLNHFYEIGPTGYIGSCPERDETLQWALMQQTGDECPVIREKATCSLGRIQIASDDITGHTITSHATILGCLKPALLYYMKKAESNTCSTYKQNSTSSDNSYFNHRLMLENCPKASDYCHTKNFCVPFSESDVRQFRKNDTRSFEAGIIIGIIVIILVVVAIVLLATFCKNPLNRGANYSPAYVQNSAISRNRKAESPDSEIPSTSKDDVFT